jgi:polysaccharide chain length determinant protein (PEP-CTERM system associated)
MSDPRIKPLITELFSHRRAVVIVFVAVNFLLLAAAFAWPLGYTSSTTILVSEKSIIQPLMQGAAATTEVADRSRMAREVINGRKVMNQVIVEAGWVTSGSVEAPDALEKTRKDIIQSVNQRTTISNVGKNLIKIEYRDDDPSRAFRTVRTLAEIFIKESVGAKAAESQAAFEFIDRQTQEYHEKLIAMEDRLKEFRIANIDARPGTEGDISTRMAALQGRIEQSTQELKEAEIKKKSLDKQLSGEAESATALSRESQYRQRIAELTAQLENLRLSYHDTYPDIVRLRHQISDLNEAIVAEKQRQQQAKATGRLVIDDSVINSPMYQQLKRDLSQTQITIDTLIARIVEARQQLNNVLERGKRVHGGEATLVELTRDYQVTRDIYQDLLRRRENARVSMNMDKENQGLTFKIQEPAALPTEPSGLQFWHFILIGLLLSVAVPVGLVYGKLRIDPRVRQPQLLVERYRLPMLVAVPHLWAPNEVAHVQRELELLTLAVLGCGSIVGLVFVLHIAGVV